MRFVTCVLAVAVAFGLASDLSAAQKTKKGKGDATAAVLRVPAGIELTTEQQAKVDAIKAGMADAVKAAAKKKSDAVPAEVLKAVAEAGKAAREAGKKGKELQAAMDAPLADLSAEQKTAYDEAMKEIKGLQDAFVAKLSEEVLTAEQKEKLPKAAPKKGKKKE